VIVHPVGQDRRETNRATASSDIATRVHVMSRHLKM
jgi:hypothetical protein